MSSGVGHVRASGTGRGSWSGFGLDHGDDRADLVHREVLLRAEGCVPEGVKVRHRFDAFLDFERFAGLILGKQRLQFVQQRLDLNSTNWKPPG